MSKLVLGKGLGHWLKSRPGKKPVAPEPVVPESPAPAPIGPGVGALLHGGNGETAAEAAPTEAAPAEALAPAARYWPRIKWMLWSGDLLLVGLALFLVCGSRPPAGFLKLSLAVLGICNGAALAIIAVLGPHFCWTKSKKE